VRTLAHALKCRYIQELHNHIRHLESARNGAGISKDAEKPQASPQQSSSLGTKNNMKSVQSQNSFRPPVQEQALEYDRNQVPAGEGRQSRSTNPANSCNLTSPSSVYPYPRPASAIDLSNPTFRSHGQQIAPGHNVAAQLSPTSQEQMQPELYPLSSEINLDSTLSSISEVPFIEGQSQENAISAMGAGSSTREQEHFYGKSSCVSFVEEIRQTQQGQDEVDTPTI
jgi:hypothetical protein